MIGITAHGAYIAAAHLPRHQIAHEWSGSSLGGEKAVASDDEVAPRQQSSVPSVKAPW